MSVGISTNIHLHTIRDTKRLSIIVKSQCDACISYDRKCTAKQKKDGKKFKCGAFLNKSFATTKRR